MTLKCNLKEFIQERVTINESSGCWEWTRFVNKCGYGQMRNSMFEGTVHRASYIAFVGVIPEGLQIDHLCKNRKCANPAHLEAVTQQENLARSNVGENMRIKTHCPKGHAYDETNTLIGTKGERRCRGCLGLWNAAHHKRRNGVFAKPLDGAAVAAVRAALVAGETQYAIASRYEVSSGVISKIHLGKSPYNFTPREDK